MRYRQQEERKRSRTIAAAALLLLAASALAAQDAERGRCLPEIEQRLDACQSGTQDVWHYTYQGPNDRQLQRSWPYKSRERAQRAMESDQRLCQTVDRYFDRVDCRTRYGGVFCAACESKDAGLEWLRADVKNSLFKEIEYWDKTVLRAARAALKIEKGRPAPGPRFGIVFREYAGQLRAAWTRVHAIQKQLGTDRQIDALSRLLDELDAEIRNTESSGNTLEALVVESTPQPPGIGQAHPMVSLTAQCARGLPSWNPVCDQAVDALFAAAKQASPSELACLKEWRAHHNCIGIYAHDSQPNPAPRCAVPSCQPR